MRGGVAVGRLSSTRSQKHITMNHLGEGSPASCLCSDSTDCAPTNALRQSFNFVSEILLYLSRVIIWGAQLACVRRQVGPLVDEKVYRESLVS